MAPAIPPEAERLYGVPPEQFVERRDALARELRRDGRRDEAERVSKLRRPSIALWAVNQLAHQRQPELRPLVEAGGRLRHGAGHTTDEVAAAIERLVGSARELVEGTGRKASDAALRQVASILRAAVADDERSKQLSAGALTEEPEAAGFEAMAALAGTSRERARAGRRDDDGRGEVDRERVRAAREELAAAQARVRELRRAADAAEREARRARSEADKAEADVEDAERRLEEATRGARARG